MGKYTECIEKGQDLTWLWDLCLHTSHIMPCRFCHVMTNMSFFIISIEPYCSVPSQNNRSATAEWCWSRPTSSQDDKCRRCEGDYKTLGD